MGTIVVFEEEGSRPKEGFLYSKFVTPFLSYFQWTLCTPFHIKLEERSGLYFCKEASLLYKIPAIISQSLQLLYILWGCVLSPVYMSDALNSAKFLHRVTYISYSVYQVIWLNLMWKRFVKIPQILNQGNMIYHSLIRESHSSSESRICCKIWLRVTCIRTIAFITVGLMSMSATLQFVYTLVTVNEHSKEDNHNNSTYSYVDNYVNTTMSSFCQLGDFWCVIQTTEFHRIIAYLTSLIWTMVMVFCETSWQISVYMMAGWAFYFRRLLSLIVRQINNATTFDEIFSATKLFAQLCLLVEEFNVIFGYLLLITLLDAILYKTITFAILFGGYAPGVDADVSYLIVCVFPAVIMLYFMADVHKLGSTVPNVLKRKYLVENGASESEPLTVEDVHRSLLAHNDVLSNGIGFKGAGFFTISFAFVGSIIGITVTYTVVMLEFTKAGQNTFF